ncbi:MAG: hypothetical protein JKY49_17915 [Cohaesibacteraceae bacterium]|nr:hypothetical protein [Cohaesibacteraceae bacterium]
MEPFDYRQITDEAVRSEYRHILSRSKRIADAMHDAYGTGKKEIKTAFVSGNTFNSFARDNGNHYLIEIDSSIPMFNLILFADCFPIRIFCPN